VADSGDPLDAALDLAEGIALVSMEILRTARLDKRETFEITEMAS
jgi:hypothetical protein